MLATVYATAGAQSGLESWLGCDLVVGDLIACGMITVIWIEWLEADQGSNWNGQDVGVRDDHLGGRLLR